MKSLFKSALLFAVSFFAVHSYAQTSNDIVDVAVSSPNHTTLVAAVKAADLVETLKLSSILTYHVVSGNLTATDVLAAIKKGKGKVVLTTVNGAKLTASLMKGKVTITDENGGKSTVTTTDLKASNGVIHVIDTVLLPK